MVRENGMVMMTEEEYWEMSAKLEFAETELEIFKNSIRKIAKENLKAEETKARKTEIEVPPSALVEIMDEYPGDEDCYETEMEISWNGIKAKLWFSPSIYNYILPAIKEAWEEMNE